MARLGIDAGLEMAAARRSVASSAATPTLTFDGADYPPGEAFALWAAHAPYDVTLPPGRTPADFGVRMQAWHVGALLVTAGAVSAMRVSRDWDRVRLDGKDNVDFMLHREAGWEGNFDGLHVAVPRGRVCVIDLARAFVTSSPDARFILLSVPRAVLALAQEDGDHHGRVLDGVPGRLVADHVEALARVLPESRVADLPALAETTLAVVGSALAHSPRSDRPRTVLSLRQRARTYVGAHLTDLDLSPERIAEALGITRSTLYRAFPSAGVAAYIRGRRLEAIRALLDTPSEMRSLTKLAADFGFASHAHLTTAFRRRFGVPPSRARGIRRREGPETSVATFQEWQRELDEASQAGRSTA